MPKPVIIYGGPYAHESDAITAESTKKSPNYDKLTSGWNTITQGAHDFIESLKKPVEAPEGPFVENVKVDYDKEDTYIPKTAEFDNALGKMVEDEPEKDESEDTEDKTEGQTEVDLDKL